MVTKKVGFRRGVESSVEEHGEREGSECVNERVGEESQGSSKRGLAAKGVEADQLFAHRKLIRKRERTKKKDVARKEGEEGQLNRAGWASPTRRRTNECLKSQTQPSSCRASRKRNANDQTASVIQEVPKHPS